MSIKLYKDNLGREFYEVYIRRRDQVSGRSAQRRRRGIETLGAAKRWAGELARECEQDLLQKKQQGSTWGAVVEAFEERITSNSRELHSTSLSDYLAALRSHTKSWWDSPAAEITALTMEDLISLMQGQGYSVGHISKIRGVIHKVFVYGIKAKLIKDINESPILNATLPKAKQIEKLSLNTKEIRSLLAHARNLNHPWFYIWALALYTGMRNGELYALLWSDVDFVSGMITVRHSYNKRLNITKCPKAGYSRQVPISPELNKLLLEIREQTKDRPQVLPRITNWNRGEQARVLRQFCIGLGLPAIRFHDLRACFATQLIRNNVPIIQIQKICGWKDLKTMQRYIRLAGIEIAGATESLKFLSDAEAMEHVGNLLKP